MSEELDELDWDDDSVICDGCNRPFIRSTGKGCPRQAEHKVPDLADIIVEDVEYELCGRKGIGNVFEGCDLETQQEMRDSWAALVRKRLTTEGE